MFKYTLIQIFLMIFAVYFDEFTDEPKMAGSSLAANG